MNDIYNVKGRIFDIQKFSVHDGPGIRTIVFLKGCRLRCKWCCNPESQNYEIETMLQNGKKKTIGYDTTVGDVMAEVMKDYPYYRRSGGGLTLSGGESLAQPEFATALLYAAKESGINTAMETTGYANYDVVEKYIPLVDCFLMDIKHINSEKHKQFTTQPNELILENAKKIAQHANKLIIRVPVIPTFNDTQDEIRAIAEFAISLKTVKKLHILPYHRLGYDKYVGLGRNYELEDIKSPSKEHMEMLKTTVEATGLECQIGG